jgi:hypothetical protein
MGRTSGCLQVGPLRKPPDAFSNTIAPKHLCAPWRFLHPLQDLISPAHRHLQWADKIVKVSSLAPFAALLEPSLIISRRRQGEAFEGC